MGHHTYLIPLLPLVAAAVCSTGRLGQRSHWPVWVSVGASALLSFWLLIGMLSGRGPEGANPYAYSEVWFNWFSAGSLSVDAAAWVDPLTVTMLCVVCGIGTLITVFAAGYMRGEAGYARFFSYVALFIFAMTTLVLADNLVLLYLGWEGVGLCSYLLVGYYYEKPAARDAARKAFLANRVGDAGFMLGILAAFGAFGTVKFFDHGAGLVEQAARFATLDSAQQWALGALPFLLMLGAFGKSAQFPLHVWLPDAMEGPTPVSALIHAATMVTAGVYMLVRLGPVFTGNEPALVTVCVVGAFTAVMAGTIALRQFDLKKVFAYSTVSQLGFMFVAAGALAPVAATFHLVTHAFFKALLFLCSGLVMHALLGHLDLRRMSGLKTQLPMTRWLTLIGCLALAGFPVITSGFWSKDEILAAALHANVVLFVVMLGTAALTAYYTFRVYFRVFEGPTVVPDGPADDHHVHDEHDPHHGPKEPWIMVAPLAVLAVGALAAGVLNLPGSHWLGDFLGHSPSLQLGYNAAVARFGSDVDATPFGQHVAGAHAGVHWLPMIAGSLAALGGIGAAWFYHLKDRRQGERLPELPATAGLARFFEGKYHVDEVYAATLYRPTRLAGSVADAFDRYVIDGLVLATTLVPQAAGLTFRFTTQRGRLQGYALTMFAGVAVILAVVFLR